MSPRRPKHATALSPPLGSPEAPRHAGGAFKRYKQIIELQEEYISLATLDGTIIYANEAYARLHAKSSKEIVGLSLFDFISEDSREYVRRQLSKLHSSPKSIRIRNQIVLPDDRRLWVLWINRIFEDRRGGKIIHSVGRDIQQEMETEARLKESEARYRLLAEASTDVVMAFDRNLVRTYVSPSSSEVFGYAPDELIGSKTGESAHPDDAAHLQQNLRALLDGELEKYVGLNRRRHRDGHWIWAETCYRAIRSGKSGEITGIVASVRDVTARKTAEVQLADAYDRLAILAGEDGLTGLANRRAFDDAFDKEHKRVSRSDECLCLLMIDVDHFKAFNDSYGHPAGDESLRKVAAAIKGCLHRANDLAVRYGGEEFAVMSPGLDEKGGRVIAERIRRTVRELNIEHKSSEHKVVTVSIGVASESRREFARSKNSLLDRADAALYSAKRNGRDRVEISTSQVVLFRKK